MLHCNYSEIRSRKMSPEEAVNYALEVTELALTKCLDPVT
jgi:hypothetical protein